METSIRPPAITNTSWPRLCCFALALRKDLSICRRGVYGPAHVALRSDVLGPTSDIGTRNLQQECGFNELSDLLNVTISICNRNADSMNCRVRSVRCRFRPGLRPILSQLATTPRPPSLVTDVPHPTSIFTSTRTSTPRRSWPIQPFI